MLSEKFYFTLKYKQTFLSNFLLLQGCIIVRQLFGYFEKVLELCGVKVTEK